MRIFRTYQKIINLNNKKGISMEPGPSIIAQNYEHAQLCTSVQGLGHLRVSNVGSMDLGPITNKIVEWDDLIRPSKLQLN